MWPAEMVPGGTDHALDTGRGKERRRRGVRLVRYGSASAHDRRHIHRGASNMAVSDFRPGDEVTYRDLERVRWGPWKILDVLGDDILVEIDEEFSYAMSARLLDKVGSGRRRN